MKNKYISYYELLGMIKEGNIPKRIYVKFPQVIYGVNYIAIYDNGDFSHYYAEEDDINYKSYLNDCFLESDMFGIFIQVLDEEEFETIDELLIEYDDGDIGINEKYISSQQSEIFAKSINQLIKNQKKIIEKLNKEN